LINSKKIREIKIIQLINQFLNKNNLYIMVYTVVTLLTFFTHAVIAKPLCKFCCCWCRGCKLMLLLSLSARFSAPPSLPAFVSFSSFVYSSNSQPETQPLAVSLPPWSLSCCSCVLCMLSLCADLPPL